MSLLVCDSALIVEKPQRKVDILTWRAEYMDESVVDLVEWGLQVVASHPSPGGGRWRETVRGCCHEGHTACLVNATLAFHQN